MEDWINQNKDWFLSGAGIFIISTICSFLSILATLWLKSRRERRKRRRLEFSEEKIKFVIPQTNGKIDKKSLSVSYKGKEYKNLCYYSISVTNTGNVAIENQDLLFTIPSKNPLLERTEETSNSAIKLTIEGVKNSNDFIYKIDRIECEDTFSISMLINIEDPEIVKCLPRGVDNIDYIFEKTNSKKNDIELLFFVLAIFIVADMVPVIGNLLQGIIILFNTPLLVRLLKDLIQSRKKSASIIFNDVTIDITDSSSVTIGHNE
ncbi:Ig-like domain-containing protein [Candidatus Electrothrix laxa]